MTKYPINLALNGSTIVETRGSFLYYESASAGGMDTSIKIVISGAKGGEVVLQVGQGFKLDIDYDRLTISNNLNQGVIVGQLVISDGSFFDHRVIGTVSVIDGGKSRTLGNTAFMGVLTAAATAGNLSHVSISNLAGSGKNIIVKTYQISTTTADFVFGQILPAPLASDSGPFKSKLGGGASSTARNQYQIQVASLITVRQEQVSTQTGTTILVTLQEPVVLPPGYCFVFVPNTVNNGISVSIEFTEEPV